MLGGGGLGWPGVKYGVEILQAYTVVRIERGRKSELGAEMTPYFGKVLVTQPCPA